MTTKVNKIQQLKSELKLMTDTIIHYEKLFCADDKASTEDLEKLNKLKVSIKKIEAKINPIKKIEAKIASKKIDWDSILYEYNQALVVKIGRLKIASDRAKGYITQEDESNDGHILFNSLLAVVGSFGPRYTIGVEILKMALEILNKKPKDTITEFHSSWIDSLTYIEKKINNLEIENEFIPSSFSGYLEETIFNCREENEVDHNEVFFAIPKFLDAYFISEKQMEQIYTTAWINSTENSSAIPLFGGGLDFKEADGDAGYIYISTTYTFPLKIPTIDLIKGSQPDLYKEGSWEDKKLYIDDVARPKGTNEALVAAFKGTTPLVKLPFKIVAQVTISHPYNSKIYPLYYPQKYTKAYGQSKWVLEKGDEKIFNIFLEYIKTKVVDNLGKE